MSVSLSHSPPQASVKHLIRHFEPGCPSHPQNGLPPAKWMDVPFDIMREVCSMCSWRGLHSCQWRTAGPVNQFCAGSGHCYMLRIACLH